MDHQGRSWEGDWPQVNKQFVRILNNNVTHLEEGGGVLGLLWRIISRNTLIIKNTRTYKIKQECLKIFDISRFKRLALEGIDSSYGCPDYVAIYDGALVDYLPITKLCGSSDVTNLFIRSSGDSLRVEFYTDFSITAPGFIAVFWQHGMYFLIRQRCFGK